MLNSNEYRPGAGPADNYKQNYEEYKMQTETKRLIIRSFRPGDEKAFAEMAKDGSLREIGFDADFQDWMGDWAAEAAELTKKDDARADYIPCTVVLRSTGEIVGNVGCTYFEDLKKVGICYFALLLILGGVHQVRSLNPLLDHGTYFQPLWPLAGLLLNLAALRLSRVLNPRRPGPASESEIKKF